MLSPPHDETQDTNSPAEDSLKCNQMEERYHSLFEFAPDGIVITDMNGVILSVNSAALSLSGYSKDQVVGEHFSKIISMKEKDILRLFQIFIFSSQQETPKPFAISISRQDGTKVWVEAHIGLLEVSSGKKEIQIILRNIDDRKRAEDELLFKNTLLEAEYETSPDGILVVDREDKAILFNNRFGEMWCIPQATLNTRSRFQYLVHLLNQVKKPKTFIKKVEYLYEHEDEKSRDEIELINGKIFDRYSSPLIDSNGKYHGRIWFFRDITERKRYEEKLEALHEHSIKMAENKSVDEIAESTLNAMEQTLGFKDMAFGVVEGDFVYFKHKRGETSVNELPLEGPGLTVRAIRTGKTQLVHDTRKNKDYISGSFDGKLESLSELDVPIKIGDEVVAVLNIESERVGAFDIKDQRLVETLAQHVASAMSRLKHTEMLRASKEKWRNLLEESMDAVLIIVGTKLGYVNRRLADFLGYSSPSELIGSDLLEFVTPEYREMIRTRTLRRQRGEEEPERYEYKVLRRDGTQIDVETQTSLIKYEGKPAALSFIRDITEHKQYEERLQALHRHATELGRAETMEEIGETTFDAIELVLGFGLGSFIAVEGDHLHFVHTKGFETGKNYELPLDGPGITVRATRTGETQLVPDVRLDDDFILGRAEGRYEPLSELAVPVKVDGEAVAIINVESDRVNAFDKNDQRLLEIFAEHVASAIRGLREQAERQRYEERLEVLHRHATELSKSATIKDVAEMTFDAIEQVLGFDLANFAIVDGNLLRDVSVRGIESVEDYALSLDGPGITVRAVNTGETQPVPDTRLDEDFTGGLSQDVYGSLSELAVPVKIGGEVVAVINVESIKQNAFTELDQKLLEIFSEHIASAIAIIRHRESLQRSLKELERSNRELDDYTYVVSHDLKAPLRSITAFSKFLLDDYSDNIDETGQEYLNRIMDASMRMDGLIKDLLVLSRVGRKYTELELVDLNKLMKNVILDFDAQLKTSGAEVVVGELPTIMTQKVWIRQLLANLISNGLKFNNSPNPRVEVSCDERQSDYLFSVKDNGIGIREEDQKRLFKLFERLHTQDEYPGTGAGLAICKKIVESIGGEIWVESVSDEGSTFYFTYPRKGGADESIPQPQAESYDIEVPTEHATQA